ncbi:MAG: hypothetical protein COX70_01900 [Flavobacteriales bacterium CG_4_10_14_0_2_um_filter_32_8]|nr:MAG: hypothetical protein COX70_01900 [Flavobacteriales bacterium CG_4_10_14_0_2_um_filter_32_8]PJB15745.1 MAG: hypothetical protein CO118_02335 [Flavobacteriales bacterium CG_4_9_14_3_um_filter_32_8]
MIKKLLFITTILTATSSFAQNLDLKDNMNNSIAGQTYYIYNSGPNMANTKFHVGNSSGSPINFDCSLWEMSNPTLSEWQVCFGTSCYIANDGDPNAQNFSFATAPATGIYPDLKVAPFSFGWVTGDFGVWRVRVFDNANPIDSSTCYIVWTVAGTPTGDIDANTMIDGLEIAGDANLNGVIDGTEIAGDMNGNGVIDPWEVSGDENGNGIIDGGEVLSTIEVNDDHIIFSTYPNPVSTNLSINYSFSGGSKNAKIDVYDVLGQKVNTYLLNDNKGKLTISTNKLNAGVYFYAIKVDEKTIKTERVIVK